MTMRPRTCRACGAVFPGGPRAWYCPTCREARRREASRNAKARARRGEQRPMGSVDGCVVCGGGYIVTGPNQKYCPECAPEAILAVDRRQGMEYYHANAAEINPPRKLARRKGPRQCVICGAVFEAPTAGITCGNPECKAALRRIYGRRADAKRRGRRR